MGGAGGKSAPPIAGRKVETVARKAATAPEPETVETEVRGDVDRVAIPSLRADGTPDQSPGFEVIGD